MRKYASAAILTTLVGAGLGFGVSPAFAADDVSCEGAIGATTVKSVVVPEDDDAQWFCSMNVDTRHNNCDAPQEPDDAMLDMSACDLSGLAAS